MMNNISLSSYYRDINPLSPIEISKKALNFNDCKYKIEQNAINTLKCKCIQSKDKCSSSFTNYIDSAKKSLTKNHNINSSIKTPTVTDINSNDEGDTSNYNDLLINSTYRNSINSYNQNYTYKSSIDKISASNIDLAAKDIRKNTTLKINSFEDAQKAIEKCKRDITDFSSQAVLLQASYLISAAAVIPLFYHYNNDDDSDEY